RRRGTLVARAEDALQLVGRSDLELVVAADLRPLVGAPADELRRVPEARALHVVVGDLAHALGPERLPAQILAAVPAAGGARKTLPLGARLELRLGPIAPGMTVQRVLAQRRQLGHEPPARLVREGGRD